MPVDPLAEQHLAGVLAGREEQVGEPVGLDPVGLLGHVVAVAAQAGLDVEQRHPGGDGGAGAGDRRVGVAADEHRVGPLGLDHPGDPLLGHGDALVVGQRADAEVVFGQRQPQVGDLQVRHRRVVVLPGVDQDLLDAVGEGERERSRLHDLGAGADDGDDPGCHCINQRARRPSFCAPLPKDLLRRELFRLRPFFSLRIECDRRKCWRAARRLSI